MNAPKDLTRWNRAGLNHFRYVNGNAVTYLETLRQQLVKRFKDPQTGLCEWLNPAEEIPQNEQPPESENETMLQRQERLSRIQKRLLETYHQDKRDWAWEISRTFVRSCHILTEYVDAYANEAYLGTATQWDHVRRLVEMLDYHPAPPASASTRLVFIAKEKNTGTIGKGFQIKNSPLAGADKVIFETLEDVFVDPALNELRSKGWNKSDDPAVLPADNNSGGSGSTEEIVTGALITSWHAKSSAQLSPGEIALVYRELSNENNLKSDEAEAATISGIDKQTNAIHLLPGIVQYDWLNQWSKGETRLRVSARWKRECWLNGLNVVRTETPHGLSADSFVGWKIDFDLSIHDGLVTHGSALVNVVLTGGHLRIRIFNEIGEQVIDKTESALIGEKKIASLKSQLNPLPAPRSLSPSLEQAIIEDAILCTAYTQWRHGKIIEVDKWDLRLQVNAPLPKPGQKLYELRAIEGSVLPADYEALVLLGSEFDAPPAVEAVEPKIEVPSKAGVPEPIFTLRKVITESMTDSSGGGGGLLPPASLPAIGTFLFPSPLLPLDLVKAAVELMLSIGVMVIPSTGEIVIKGMPFGGLLEGAENPLEAATDLFSLLNELKTYVVDVDENGNIIDEDGSIIPIDEDGNIIDEDGNIIPFEIGNVVKWNSSLKPDPETPVSENQETDIIEALEKMLSVPDGEEATVLFQTLTEDIIGKGPLLAISKAPVVKAVVAASEPLYVFNGTSKIGVGDWVVGDFPDGLRALKVSAINWFTDEDKTETFSLNFAGLLGNKELRKVYADFRDELIAEGAELNTSLIEDEIELENLPESLNIGHTVIMDGCGKVPLVSKIETISGNVITVNPSIKNCSKGQLIIRANVVLAGHGESKPSKIIGSGDAAKTNQEFTLQVENVSFTADATMSSGVAAAIDVEVEGRIWQQVSSLKDSAPSDHHYAIRMTEQATVKIMFGDSENGRRLPSGKNNIRVRYRVGSGIVGNLAVGELNKAVNPHPLLKQVHQPLAAAGGGDMEDISSLRENAPPTLLALERAVSLSDFSHLAAAQSSIWQAKAYSEILHGGRTESVRVVIVPAGGVTSEAVEDEVQAFLQKHAMPGVQITVDDCIRVRFSLSITLRIKLDAYVAADVENAVFTALLEHFALKNRKLGENLYLSEVYKVVEFIEGVENSICVLNNDQQLSVIQAEDDSTVIYLDTEAKGTPSILDVTVEEYAP